MIELITQSAKLHTAHIKRLADRHLGAGCDQVLLIEPPQSPTSDFFYRIFNADGYEVEQCGNGARCAARFFYDSGFTQKTQLRADSLAGPIELHIEKKGYVTVNMGQPQFEPTRIPLNIEKQAHSYSLNLKDEMISFQACSLGNPHAVIQIPNIRLAPVATMGPMLSNHPIFPNQVNVGFMQIVDPHHINLRVYERGVGETRACGTGACAAAVCGILNETLISPVHVAFPMGHLTIRWDDATAPVYMTGPTNSVFIGRFRL